MIKDGNECLKIFEASDTTGHYSGPGKKGGCGTWSELHLGVCRADGSSIALTGGTLSSGLCRGKGVVVDPETEAVALGSCTGAQGWTAVQH